MKSLQDYMTEALNEARTKWNDVKLEDIPFDQARAKDTIMVEYNYKGRGIVTDYYTARGSNEWMKSGVSTNTTVNKGNIISDIKAKQDDKTLVAIRVNF